MTDRISQGETGTSPSNDHTVPQPEPKPATKPLATDASTSTTMTMMMLDNADEPERCCWICFATDDEDNRVAAWVKPCQCRGTTKWVHQGCLYRWIDEKLNHENSLRSVCCPQCQTEYIIVFPRMNKMGLALEAIDNLGTRLSPFLAAGFFVCSLYWTAVTFGAVTFLQVVGYDTGMHIMQTSDTLLLLIGLPIIPIGLVLVRILCWENIVLRLMHRGMEQQDYEIVPESSETSSGARIFCGALLLPTVSSVLGKILFHSMECTLQRTLFGGLTYVAVKGILKIYLRHKQYVSRKSRRIVDYTEDNKRTYKANGSNNNEVQTEGNIS